MSESSPRPTKTVKAVNRSPVTPAAKPSIVRIVGTGDGIVMRIGDRGGRWSDIVRVLSEHLTKAGGFFRGERVVIEIGERHLSADDMQQIADVLAGYNITIWAVRTSNEETHRMVREIGLTGEWQDENGASQPSSTQENERARWEVHLGQKGAMAPSAKPVAEFQPPRTIADSIAGRAIDPDIQDEELPPPSDVKQEASVDTPIAEAGDPSGAGTYDRPDRPDGLDRSEKTVDDDDAAPEVILAPPFIYHGTLRSGQVFRHAGTVMVVGDVNPGAEVISGGDIFVWGKLRGIVHAGAMGNERSVVCAIDFEPIQLRIAGHIAMSPKAISNEPGRWFWKRDVVEKPEVARVLGRQIVVDAWDSQ